ncbi:sigma-70 family RNA polymerase sigma factor [Sphingobacterium sp. ML3W]|uniref:sigma-70 family RNA polymerase sigma factor n=1 Tax=Sphingobacterium sp. ML3W TaxID=1538644 RepID=UPI00249CA411|nr:sigma-70 family RNA polymerase sigma factor [Sphingobacterium sp. ML3W]WFA79213.1 sigma-70 family RNA polymerase sigma factor [Sphingobacterium sp. ML3W]
MPKLESLSDEELLLLVSKNQDGAFHMLYERYKAALLVYAIKRVGEEAGEDLVQDVFIRTWNNRYSIDYQNDFKAYLFTALRRRIIDYFAKENNAQGYLEDLRSYASEFAFDEADAHIRAQSFRDSIFAVLHSYGPQYQAVLKLRLQGYSNPEIAVMLGLSEKTVRNQYSSTLKIIRSNFSSFLLFLFF